VQSSEDRALASGRQNAERIMKMPIKLNRAGWPRLLSALPLMSDDPRSLALGRSGAVRESFSQSLSVLKFGTTFNGCSSMLPSVISLTICLG
jgi:hypothetical protein